MAASQSAALEGVYGGMTDAAFTPSEEDLVLAGEHVTGLLSLAERAAVEARLRRDSAFVPVGAKRRRKGLGGLGGGAASASLAVAFFGMLPPVTPAPVIATLASADAHL